MYYYMLYDISTGKNTLEMFFKGLDKECMKKTEKFKRTTYFSCSVGNMITTLQVQYKNDLL